MKKHTLTITMPIGTNFGWGICGRYLTKEISRLCNVELITEDFDLTMVKDEDEFNMLKHLRIENIQSNIDVGTDQSILQAIQGIDLKPWFIQTKSPRCIGYTFFEKDRIDPQDVQRANDYYDTVVAGSSWCEDILKKSNCHNTKTIIQGIDEELFNPGVNRKIKYKDQFVIFSGGKMELRKGQDLVISAIKIMQEKYSDILLVNLWFNLWTPSMDTMNISPYIHFEMPGTDYFAAINHLLQINGIDHDRVITLPPLPNTQMSEIYKNTDIGLFPNRCEGGTNLVLMEYMACGKPVIASYSSGHKDVLNDSNSLPIKTLQPFTVNDQDGNKLYQWEDPNLDEIISKLEYAYWHRDDLKLIGEKAGDDLAKMTWKESAKQFYDLLRGAKNI